ncbi:MAG: Nif3-like dinuclear metal center hexameric protein [Clostridia bacterium]|nr:Nif3-like dinuclear metal center hexameric protein [Clostridia bacterium]
MPASIKELSAFLDARVPRSLSCAWDNDGLLCSPDPEREVHRVLVALDVTETTVNMAIDGEYDLLLTHHPVIFRPIKTLEPSAVVGRKLISLIRAGISAIALHTRLDAYAGGVNDALASALGRPVVDRFVCEDALEGRIIELDTPLPLGDFAEQVKQSLDIPVLTLSDAKRPVQKIGLVGGEGGDFIRAAFAAGCDTYLTGRAGYHNMLDSAELGINVIEAGHFATEHPVCGVLAELVREFDPAITVDIYTTPTLTVQ